MQDSKFDEHGDLRSIAVQVAADNPGLRWFAHRVVAEIDGLRSRVRVLEHVRVAPGGGHTENDPAALAAELIDLYARLDAVRALCDLADWADSAAQGAGRPSVLVDDVRASLVPR
jgi:hypothetical protein